MADQLLYDRLGGIFSIAAVVDHFSEAIVKNPIVGQSSKNPALREWHTNSLDRLPGLKFHANPVGQHGCGRAISILRHQTRLDAARVGREAHREFRISPEEFDEVAAELGRTLDFVGVPEQEKGEVLAAFAAHKDEVTQACMATAGR